MADPVWVLSVDLRTRTAAFTSGLKDAASSARTVFKGIGSDSAEMGGHVSTNMFASRHAIMAMSEAFGVTAPRAITAFLAHIGPVGAALEAAFPFTAIILGAVLLIEHLEKLKAAGEKLTEDQVKFGTAVQRAFNTLDEKMTAAQIKADELRGDHLGALALKLKEIDQQDMSLLVTEFEKVAKAADIVFADLKTHWYTLGIGADGAKHAMTSFQAQYESLLAPGKDKEASDLLRGTRDSAEKTLAAIKDAKAALAAQSGKAGTDVDDQLKYAQASAVLKAAGIRGTEAETKAQEALVTALNAQLTVEQKTAALKEIQKSNTAIAEGKKGDHEGGKRAAEGAKQAAEHARKMGELTLSIEKEQKQASLSMHEASIAERLASDTDFANRKYAIETQGNASLIAALDRHGKDYVNKLHELQMKAEEAAAQHALDLATLNAKASEASYRKQITDMEQAEREKIERTDTASAARLAAIDAAMKEETAKGLQNTAHYRELGNQRIQVEKQIQDEADKLAAGAGKEAAENALKLGEIRLSADKQAAALRDSARRQTIAQRIAEEVDFANRDYQLKQQALQAEAAALDKGAKDYENKLQAIHNRERQMAQAHEVAITGIRQKAEIDRNTSIRAAAEKFETETLAGLTRVLMGHQSFAGVMNSIGGQVVSGILENSLRVAAGLDKERLPQAESAARHMYLAGMKLPFPVNMVAAPTLAAGAFATVMAFEEGGVVPGIGRGDIVPAMLEPGEGIVPNSVMSGLQDMANNGGPSGDTYHGHATYAPVIHAVDAAGVDRMLQKHGDAFERHLGSLCTSFAT